MRQQRPVPVYTHGTVLWPGSFIYVNGLAGVKPQPRENHTRAVHPSKAHINQPVVLNVLFSVFDDGSAGCCYRPGHELDEVSGE